MATTTLRLEGFESTMRALTRAPEVVRVHAQRPVATTTHSVAARAISLVPVREGHLKAAIVSSSLIGKSLTGRVGLSGSTNVYYWRFVEFGTRFAEAQPFFRPAAEEEMNRFIERMRAVGPHIERDLTIGRNA